MIPGFNAQYLFERGKGNFLYRRRFPDRYHALTNGKTEFKLSLRCKNTLDVIEAYGRAHSHFEALIKKFEAGKSLEQQDLLEANILKPKASEFRLAYKTPEELVSVDMSELYKRLLLLSQQRLDDPISVQAILGGRADEPDLHRVLEFYEDTTREDYIGKHERQISRKKRPVRLAVQKFIEFMGHDRSIFQIARQDVIRYRSHLVNIVSSGTRSSTTANKDLMHIRKIISHYIEQNDLELKNPFARIRLKETKGKHPAFSIKYLREKWLTGNPFEEMNQEALHVVYAMLDTGAIHSEICGLLPNEIHLDTDVPYIDIRANTFRELKVSHRGRRVPLIGYALRAFQNFPEGFSKYRTPTGPANLSASVGKFLRQNDLKETDRHVLYSLRHTFKDRLRSHEFPPDLQNYLFGHKDNSMGAHYGSGYKIEHTHVYMKKLEADWYNPTNSVA